MTYFQYRINVINNMSEDYKEILCRLKFKIDYDIYVGINTEDLDLIIDYAEVIYFRNEEDLLAFKLETGI